MIDALLALLFCQFTGEVLVRSLALPVPGPVVGMALLFVALLWRDRVSGTKEPPEALVHASNALLGNLSLLFVPAAVGVIRYGSLFWSHGLVMLAAILGSTILTLAVTALVFRTTHRLLASWR